MPDLAAGTVVKGGDTPPTVNDSEAGSYTFTITAYGVATIGGTYADCGVAFIAPTSGRIEITHAATVSNSTTGGTQVAPAVRTGGTVGSGTSVLAAANINRVVKVGTEAIRAGVPTFVSGLTPGSTYNVRLEHCVSTGTGTALERTVTVKPCT